MIVTASAVVLLAVIVVVLLRSGRLHFGPGLAALLLGFCLASTGAAPTVNRFLVACASALSKLTA